MKITVGIDASNIRLGGGVTHLKELIQHCDFEKSNIEKVIIWAGDNTSEQLPKFPGLKIVTPNALNKSLVHRLIWQSFCLPKLAKKEKCDVLFIPGGSFAGNFKPIISMSQNLLPFELEIMVKFWPRTAFFKMIALRIIQSFTFKRSQGVIFLTKYAQQRVTSIVGPLNAKLAVIPHGISNRFIKTYRLPMEMGCYNKSKPFKIIYVSNIDVYKNQEIVLRAINILIAKGYPIKISFIGPGNQGTINEFLKLKRKIDPKSSWSEYLGQVPYSDIHNYYEGADLAVFASSCETFGITLLEKMASGIPLACSRLSAMPEILKDGGLYFDPGSPLSIASVVEKYLLSPQLRLEKIKKAQLLVQNYSWKFTATNTFDFLYKVALEYKK